MKLVREQLFRAGGAPSSESCASSPTKTGIVLTSGKDKDKVLVYRLGKIPRRKRSVSPKSLDSATSTAESWSGNLAKRWRIVSGCAMTVGKNKSSH